MAAAPAQVLLAEFHQRQTFSLAIPAGQTSSRISPLMEQYTDATKTSFYAILLYRNERLDKRNVSVKPAFQLREWSTNYVYRVNTCFVYIKEAFNKDFQGV